MGISLDINNINVVYQSSSVDRETIGLLVPSLSGPSFPKKFDTFEDFYDAFEDGSSAKLTKFRYLFDMGYSVAAKRVSKNPELRGSVVISDDRRFPSAHGAKFDDNYPPLIRFSRNEFIGNIKRNDNYTNHLIVRLPKDDSWSEQKPYYLTLPYIDRATGETRQALFVRNITIGGRTTQALYYYDLDINYFHLGEETTLLGRDFGNTPDGGPVFTNYLNDSFTDTKYRFRKEVINGVPYLYIYINQYLPILKPNLSRAEFTEDEKLEVYVSNIESEKYHTDLIHNPESRLFYIYTKNEDGNYGRNTSFRFTCKDGHGVLKIFRRGAMVESFQYEEDYHGFLEKVNLESKYVSLYTHELISDHEDARDERLNIHTANIDIYDDLSTPYKDEYIGDNPDDYIPFLEDFFEDDVDIDVFLYDLPLNRNVEAKLIDLAEKRDLLVLANYKTIEPSDEAAKKMLTTYGEFLFNNKTEVPAPYLYLVKMKEYYVGDVSLRSSIREISNPTNFRNVNTISFDGLRYYINYINGFGNKSFLEITRKRIHRRLYRLKDCLGTTLDDIAKKAEEVISKLRDDIQILDSISMVSLRRNNSEAKIVIEYKFPELRPEKFELNITLNILE